MIDHRLLSLYRLFGGLWLEELRLQDFAALRRLPGLAEALPPANSLHAGEVLHDELASEYQRLLGFNLPPYESVFVDPSAMLDAPATRQVEAAYRRAGWTAPSARVGAADHLGMEMLALAERGGEPVGEALLVEHLALWGPVCLLTLKRLGPQPFYAALADLSLELVLESLSEIEHPSAADPDFDPFPKLPPAPRYSGAGDSSAAALPNDEEEASTGLVSSQAGDPAAPNHIIRRLLTPCDAGLYLTRLDIARLAAQIELPAGGGERFRMLKSLYELAGQYGVADALQAGLAQLFADVETAYKELESQAPNWGLYGRAWRKRCRQTHGSIVSQNW
jgi:TorA maturation chaperone TorD